MDNYINKAMEDVLSANSGNAPLAALSLALTLPDICSQAELAKKRSTKQDYVKWCDTWIPQTSCGLDGNKYYALRCSILHNGNDDICEQNVLKGTDDETKLLFCLGVPQNTQNPSISVRINDPSSGSEKSKTIYVSSTIICRNIVQACKRFLDSNSNIVFNSKIIIC